jgi:hypothetical protein
MSKTLLYGLHDEEHLQFDDPDEVVARLIDDAAEAAGEPFDSIADRLTWPIKVVEYKPMALPPPEQLAGRLIEKLFESLDDELADPDGDPTEPTEAVNAAALALARAVIADYDVWAHEPTGGVIEYSRERARALEQPG